MPDAPEPAPGSDDPEENGKEEELAERLPDLGFAPAVETGEKGRGSQPGE